MEYFIIIMVILLVIVGYFFLSFYYLSKAIRSIIPSIISQIFKPKQIHVISFDHDEFGNIVNIKEDVLIPNTSITKISEKEIINLLK